MDLDNIKKTWQETEIKPDIGDDKIQKMISNEGKSAFNSLLKVEKFALFLMIPCSLFGIFLCNKTNLLMGVFYLLIVVFSTLWQVYKIKFLKKNDLSAMGILDVAKRITKYKAYIIKEIIAGIIFILLFCILYTYFGMPSMHPELNNLDKADLRQMQLIMLGTGLGAGILFSYITYRMLYIKNIRKIEKSVKEIEEFDKEM
ncbi:hypothetical protein LJC28_01965 [Dysgonomonas sp. OttesenSCG-928-D17]|nr:hypothetical protein [Dysgonomonas sp. OttesenSCG-928-D17]